ncbi:purine nucleoside permease [Leucosporidium creatinivorum]|uniref:Purine nucleoside permease n=1 Tax=Leucosporidium creatinivorum TaxID=106004 RepID=A0A1Y2F1C5_9BASI|nr:purine nucleoside permease [Leucosporidium creatinivorum]
MRFLTSPLTLASSLLLALAAPAAAAPSSSPMSDLAPRAGKIAPKVMVISMFTPEREVWIEPMQLVVNYTIPGLSPLFPYIACNKAHEVCIVTTGEAEINAASTIMAVTLSTKFDFTSTYWLVAGIAGINPYHGTLGTAAFARFSVQVGLEYELDARQMPSNWTTGYWALGSSQPGELPDTSDLYGTEVFELNTNLLQRAMIVTKHLTLNDSTTAAAYRKKFDYAPANLAPKVTQCDVLTSDVYFAGTLLAEGFGNYTDLVTKGKGTYCTTAQEDNATLEAMVRAHKAKLVDYSRIIVLRTASDFDRAPPGNVTAYDAFEAAQGGFEPAIENLVVVGKPLVEHIIKYWKSIYKAGVAPQSGGAGSFYGDNLGTIRSGPAQARRIRRGLMRR